MGVQVTFTDLSSGNPSAFEWDLDGDGAFDDSTERNPTFTYTTGGLKTVRLRASVPDPAGLTAFGLTPGEEIKTDFIQVVEADFGTSPTVARDTVSTTPITDTSGTASVNVFFTDQSAGFTGGGQIRWDWDFGDGSTFTTTADAARSPTHTYASAGTFNVSLQVTDPAGTHSVARAGLVTIVKTPVADLAVDPALGGAPLDVQVTDRSVNFPDMWAWEVWLDGPAGAPDGAFSESADTRVFFSEVAGGVFEQSAIGAVAVIPVENPPLRMTSGGSFHIRLVATNAASASAALVRENVIQTLLPAFEARLLPDGSFSTAPLTLTVGDAVEFRDVSDGTVTSRVWDVNNDGVTDSGAETLTFTYTTGGSFAVSLRAIGPAISATSASTASSAFAASPWWISTPPS